MAENEAGDPPVENQPAREGVRHLAAVEADGVAPRTLSPRHLADLESSGLDASTIDASGVYSEGKSGPIAELLGWGWRNGGGLVFPFHDYDSRALLLSRVKPDKPRTKTSSSGKVKPIKYEQAPGTGAIPYIGPRTIREQRLDDVTRPIVWTEGEKKTLLLDQLGFAALGLTGCHNFNDGDANRNGDGIVWAKALRKYAERFTRGRHHVIAYDSDAASNEGVLLAMRRLAGLLLEGGAASTKFVRVPVDASDVERGVGVDDYLVEHGEPALRALFDRLEPIAVGEDVSPIAPRDPLAKLGSLAWLRGARLDGDLRVPPRFELHRDRSLWIEPDRPDGDAREIMRSVLLPVRLLDALEGDEQRFEVAYHARDAWHRAVVDRRACKDTRRALAELPPDCAITTNNAALVVLWIDEYMRTNEHRLTVERFATECGWQPINEGRCFMLDKPISSSDGVNIVADDAGDRGEILAALRTRGTLDAHLEALRDTFVEDRLAAVAILAALAAPLLQPLAAPNFAVNFFGDSSKGKTSIVKIAGSVYGDPKSEQWIGSWNATPVAMELRAATLTHLPLCFDEVGAGDARVIERSIYMLINGCGKSRGDRSLAVRKTPKWSTVVLSTGERELVDERAATGAQVRVLQFRVAGFGALDAKGVDALREACERNHGHAGRAWIEALVAVDDWRALVELFEESKRQFRGKSAGALAGRQAVFFALLAVAEHLASSVLGIGEKGGKTVRALFADGEKRRELLSAGERAIESVSQWIASEPDAFPVLNFDAGGALRSTRVRNVRAVHGVRHKEFVYLLPDALRAHFDVDGLSFAEVCASWRDRGLLEVDPGRVTTKIKYDGARVRVVALKCDAVGVDVAAATVVQTDFAD